MLTKTAMTTTNGDGVSALKVAVVICTHNRSRALERCLQRLQHVNAPDFSIVVVDSAPNSPATKSLATRYDTQYEVSPLKGVSRARNIGLRATRADIIVYLDDDMVTHGRWLQSLIEPFANGDVMAVTGPMLPLELVKASSSDLRLALELAPRGPYSFDIDRCSRQWFERTNFGGVGDGNYAIRRSALDQIGGFDERLGRGGLIDGSEEHYAFFRLVEHGFKIVYCPQAIVFHPFSPPDRDALRKQIVDTVAFAAFLMWNHPAQSWRVLKFLAGGVFRIRRWWRTTTRSHLVSLSASNKVMAALEGLSIFMQSLYQAYRNQRQSQ